MSRNESPLLDERFLSVVHSRMPELEAGLESLNAAGAAIDEAEVRQRELAAAAAVRAAVEAAERHPELTDPERAAYVSSQLRKHVETHNAPVAPVVSLYGERQPFMPKMPEAA